MVGGSNISGFMVESSGGDGMMKDQLDVVDD